MLSIFTKYLLQYKRVCIPHVGTFELVQQSPQLDVADKLFTPPSFTTRYLNEYSLPEHQVLYFAISVAAEKERLKYELSSFGQDLKNRIEKDPFRWNGFGTLRYTANELVFEPNEIRLESMQRLRADRVVHPNISHNVLVGDQELTFADTARSVDRTGYKMPVYMIIGWVILVLALAAIAYVFVTGNFQTVVSGLRTYFDSYF